MTHDANDAEDDDDDDDDEEDVLEKYPYVC